ncbi:MAG: aminotransferase class V-fold PLP-dependent enzyme [Deltaproteobacteria bacterium]|nr:MAG: aminotransferase class V-fold PLP-dependent enzyme [Deltaproteobacteria bacterium]
MNDFPAHEPNWAEYWLLAPGITFLNHGSFGACPKCVLAFQQDLRQRMEREPVTFFVRAFERRLDEAREALAAFVGANPGNLVFVPNATYGINAVLRSLPLAKGDELLVTNHEYNASRNALDFVAQRAGARVVPVKIPFPIDHPERVVEAILDGVTPRTRLALVDHVTSQTGLIFPVERIVRELDERGIDTLVDGAHGPGMLPLDLEGLGAAYYAGNCHKWICAPKGAALLYVRKDRQQGIHPLAISHGANVPAGSRSRFHLEFDWTGTHDATAWLSVPEAIRFMGSILPGGWAQLRARNRSLVLLGRQKICAALSIPEPAPAEMIGSLAALPLPDGEGALPASPLYTDPLHETLFTRYRIEVPVIPWPAPPKRLLRISAQLYNIPAHYDRLAEALRMALSPAPGTPGSQRRKNGE